MVTQENVYPSEFYCREEELGFPVLFEDTYIK
jgi:hypothetical protein